MPNKPEFITFTGPDDHTSIDEMIALSAKYPIEWGVLFSPKKQGQARFPSMDFVHQLWIAKKPLNLSAHICGRYSAQLIEFGRTDIDEIMEHCFNRIQVNTCDPLVSAIKIRSWANKLSATAILQCRKEFPLEREVFWLYDQSGGRGILPKIWPNPVQDDLCGYAGGLNAENVTDVVVSIGAMAVRYWIDMESGVRDENDQFSIDKCREVCEAVYGKLA